jgi:hypothetical protein
MARDSASEQPRVTNCGVFRLAAHWQFGILIFAGFRVFGRFSAELGPQTPLERRGSSCSAGRTKNQPRRPSLRPFRGNRNSEITPSNEPLSTKVLRTSFLAGYLKADWPDFLGASLRSGRPRGPGKALKSVGGEDPHLFEGLPGPPRPARPQTSTPKTRPNCLQVPSFWYASQFPGGGSFAAELPRDRSNFRPSACPNKL